MFLPAAQSELKKLGWDRLDVILVTGDSYIDSPYIGVSIIGKVLLAAGYRVGIIAQPDIDSEKDIMRLGEPELFWGVTAGCLDSMVANYTATKKRRKQDDYTPGGDNCRRPNRACIVYSNLIRRCFKKTVPIVLGGLEASLRRIAHYDYWDDAVRRSVLFDAKADMLLYGMAEQSIQELSDKIKKRRNYKSIRGLCYIGHEVTKGFIELPSFEETARCRQAFSEMFMRFYAQTDPLTGRGLVQKHGDRYLIHNPPSPYLTGKELDRVHELGFERALHPDCARNGAVRALETIRFSIPSHRGCYGECSFCSIAVHQGRTVRWRSRKSIVREARHIAQHKDFKGIISDIGGPTANMYGFECRKKIKSGACIDRHCLYPEVCTGLRPDHGPQIRLLRDIRTLPGIKKVFIASGLRYDLLEADRKHEDEYIRELVGHHVSGQLKVAPEHSEEDVLDLMGKPGAGLLKRFIKIFDKTCRLLDKRNYLTYYLIAAHPGCTDEHMHRLRRFAARELKTHPEQVQIFTPSPSTIAALMYYTERDPFTGRKIFVEKTLRGRERQKRIIMRG